MIAPRKIGLFGGTFDPVHLGHIHLAKLAKEAVGLDEVRFLPCQISPHKPGSSPASCEDRCEMLRLATAEFPWVVVDDFELRESGPSYSYLTAEAMVKKFPNDRLFWMMGGDQWDALPGWKRPEHIAALVEFIVLARGETPVPRAGYRLHIVKGEHPASATEIRRAISNGSVLPGWITPAVARWIAENNIYRSP